jgi:hypothetical protein
MADNVVLNRVSGLEGDTVAADEISGVQHQRVKVQYGDDGSATDASTANPLPTRPTDAWLDITEGNISGRSIVHKFGANEAVGTTFVPVCRGGIYRTPQTGSATTLRVKAGDSNDTADGSGARQITLQGLGVDGTEITETLATAGASASAVTSNSFIRLYRFWVSQSGTYATQDTASHAAAITIENGAGGTDWGTIFVTDYGRGQSEVGYYSVAAGVTGYVSSMTAHSDTARTTELLFFQRTGILQTAAPYDGWRLVLQQTLEGGESSFKPQTPLGPFVGPCDIGFMAKVEASTAIVEVDFEILLIAD